MAPPDSRQEVGGFVWAPASSVSCDTKRICGSLWKSTWLRGTVLGVHKERGEAAKRSTTYVHARYPIGKEPDGRTKFKEQKLALQTLKHKHPNKKAPNEKEKEGAPQDATANRTVPIEEPKTPQATNEKDQPSPETVATAGSASTSSMKAPGVTVHDQSWCDGDTQVNVNGPHSQHYWEDDGSVWLRERVRDDTCL